MTRVSRRTLLTGLVAGGGALAVGVPLSRSGGTGDTPPAEVPPSEVRAALETVVAAEALAPLTAGARAAVGGDRDRLATDLLEAVPDLLDTPREALGRRVRVEHRRGAVVTVDGWQLSVSEARAIVLLGT